MKTGSTIFLFILISLFLTDFYAQDITWTPMNTGLTETNIRSVTITPNDFVFAATNTGVFRSTNSGAIWEKVGNGMNSEYVNSLFANSNGEVFTACENGAVFTSSDYGINWTQINVGLGNLSVYSVTQNSAGDLFIGTSGTGIYRSTNGGINWTQTNNGFLTSDIFINCMATANSDVLLAGTGNDGLYRSTDNGDSWNQVVTTTAFLYLAKSSSGDLYGCTTNGLLKSTDNGASWQSAINGLTTTYVNGISFNKAGELFAATYGGGVFKSTDSGSFWQPQNSGLVPTNIWSLAVNSSGYLFAGSNDAGVYRTVDQTTSVEGENINVSNFRLEQNYPNPFNPSTTIDYVIPSLPAGKASGVEGLTTLRVYNLLGKEVVTLVNENKEAGAYEVEFDASNHPSGVYLYKLKAGDYTETKKMLLLK